MVSFELAVAQAARTQAQISADWSYAHILNNRAESEQHRRRTRQSTLSYNNRPGSSTIDRPGGGGHTSSRAIRQNRHPASRRVVTPSGPMFEYGVDALGN